jgi:hypothetical protein
MAENIMHAWQSRAQSQDWAAWVRDNPNIAELLAEAEKLCQL